jgi:hypothetical protein
MRGDKCDFILYTIEKNANGVMGGCFKLDMCIDAKIDAVTPVTPVSCHLQLSLEVKYGLHPIPLTVVEYIGFVMIPPCPSRKQTSEDKIAAWKRRAHDFMGQQRSSDNDVQTSYLESVDNYEYDMLAIARLITR